VRYLRTIVAFVLSAALFVSPTFAARVHRAPTSGHSHSSDKATPKVPKGQKAHKVKADKADKTDTATAPVKGRKGRNAKADRADKTDAANAPIKGRRGRNAKADRAEKTDTADTPVKGRRGRKGRKVLVAVKAPRLHGQQSIDPARVTEIQQALIREHYLSGEATGRWDADTAAAMQKYQADQGWQTKLMPDSRAIKKLGLGPDYSNAINAKGSSFTEPSSTGTTTPTLSSSFTAASGVSR
jgi:hypothetical protein